ncbi:probable dolichyl pyrophosphate Glc1Man9GlcNAc2 alpha-1,3-glucosyltransferase isoform X2 [Photinus pyralis]|nr:probable dolichyl pyrophosphate Glc1Man9GlcNAc2 alpha-1,3-glucosyltransferase isoform X2 [Photinus pyralis]
MLVLNNHNYASFKTILFQRLSVILTDAIFAYGSYRCSQIFRKSWKSQAVLPLLLLTNVGLLLVDHIHFQYNGIMFGFLLLSCANLFQANYLSGAFWFLVLLNFKHIYLYIAPAYFIYLLRNYCITSRNLSIKNVITGFSVRNTIYLGSTVILVFAVTFVPFVGHINQVMSRLFPFKRGLCHAYWAPNFWAIYNVADKVLFMLGKKIGLAVSEEVAAMTGGLVQEFSHAVLPSITPLATMLITIVFMLPALMKLWFAGNNPVQFVRCIILCALTSFMFGWHVHEKAILMAIIPFSIISIMESGDAKVFLILSTVGQYSLLPLLFPQALLLIKLILYVLYCSYAFYSMSNLYPFYVCKFNLPLLNMLESMYIFGLIPLFLYDHFLHYSITLRTYPFLPLLLTSVYCSIGIVYSWLKYYIYFLTKCDAKHKI